MWKGAFFWQSYLDLQKILWTFVFQHFLIKDEIWENFNGWYLGQGYSIIWANIVQREKAKLTQIITIPFYRSTRPVLQKCAETTSS